MNPTLSIHEAQREMVKYTPEQLSDLADQWELSKLISYNLRNMKARQNLALISGIFSKSIKELLAQ